MNFEQLNTIVPPLLFFVVFFIVFSFLELVLIAALNHLGQRYWEFMIDVVIRSSIKHKQLIRWVLLVVAFSVIAILLVFTPILQVLAAATPELKFFAVVLAFLMVVMHFINTRNHDRIVIKRKIYRTIFFFVSIIIYVFTLILANQSYGRYQAFINTQLVDPTVGEVEDRLEENEKQRLLAKFTEMYLDGGCKTVDYREETESGLINLVYIANDPMLAYGVQVDLEDPGFFLQGEACSDGENTFLLNANGNWYWVISENL